MRARSIALIPALALLSACAAHPEAGAQDSVTIGAITPWPATVYVRQNDPPRILAAQFSSSVIRIGESWSGRVATTSNVAVVELRAPSFSFIMHRSAFGQFSFRTSVLAVPSIYRRGFTATLVARGAGGGLTDSRTAELVFR